MPWEKIAAKSKLLFVASPWHCINWKILILNVHADTVCMEKIWGKIMVATFSKNILYALN